MSTAPLTSAPRYEEQLAQLRGKRDTAITEARDERRRADRAEARLEAAGTPQSEAPSQSAAPRRRPRSSGGRKTLTRL